MATVCFRFQSDERLPPGSQLLVTQQVSRIYYIVLFASFKTGAHAVDFSEISYRRCCIPMSPEKPPPSPVRIRTGPVSVWGRPAGIMQTFQSLPPRVPRCVHVVSSCACRGVSWRPLITGRQKRSRTLWLQVGPLGFGRSSSHRSRGITIISHSQMHWTMLSEFPDLSHVSC